MLLCSSSLRPPPSLGGDRILRLATEAGFAGIAIDRDIPQPLVKAVAIEALRGGVPVAFCAGPLPVEELAKGRRLPHLASFQDPEERLAAVKLGRSTLELAGELSVGTVALHLGPVALRTPEAGLRLAFARRQMEEGEPGHRLLRQALDERKASAMAIYDACRAALEPLLRTAAEKGTTLVLSIAANPWQVPSPREAQLLLREFAGAPLGLLISPARRSVLASLRLGGPAARWDELWPASRALWASDCCGLDDELLLGTGQLQLELPPDPGPPALAGVIAGSPESTFKEILRARRALEEVFLARDRARTGPPTSPGQSAAS